MFKQGDKVTITRPDYTQRERRKNDPGDGGWILERKKKDKTVNGVIGDLSRFYLPIQLADGTIKHKMYDNLTFLINGRASYKTKLPDRHWIKAGKPVNVVGKNITITGKVMLDGIAIPVLLNGELINIPYEKLTFLKEKK